MSRSTTRLGAAAAVTAAGSLAALVSVATAAHAAYPPNTPQCSIATGGTTPGATVTLSGVGFTPGQQVTVGGSGSAVLTSTSTTADSAGAVRVLEKLGKPGSAQFTLSGTPTSERCTGLSAVVKPVVEATVAARPAAKPPAVAAAQQPTRVLAFTGAQGVVAGSVVGLGLLVGGTALVLTGRRRSRAGA